MSYNQWFADHAAKHAALMQRLVHLTDEEVIAYFRFENMVKHEPDFCPLYPQNRKCHNLETLNCYLCACPHFRFDDRGLVHEENKTLYSTCSINSPKGTKFTAADAIHHDCSSCTIPHDEEYIRAVFSRDWSKIMRKVPPAQTRDHPFLR